MNWKRNLRVVWPPVVKAWFILNHLCWQRLHHVITLTNICTKIVSEKIVGCTSMSSLNHLSSYHLDIWKLLTIKHLHNLARFHVVLGNCPKKHFNPTNQALWRWYCCTCVQGSEIPIDVPRAPQHRTWDTGSTPSTPVNGHPAGPGAKKMAFRNVCKIGKFWCWQECVLNSEEITFSSFACS